MNDADQIRVELQLLTDNGGDQGFVALAAGLALLPAASNLPLMIGALVIVTYGFSVVTPALNSALSLSAPEDVQGGVLGLGRSTSTLARAAGPAVAGYLFALLGKDWPFLIGAAIIGVVLVFCLVKGSDWIARPNT